MCYIYTDNFLQMLAESHCSAWATFLFISIACTVLICTAFFRVSNFYAIILLNEDHILQINIIAIMFRLEESGIEKKLPITIAYSILKVK